MTSTKSLVLNQENIFGNPVLERQNPNPFDPGIVQQFNVVLGEVDARDVSDPSQQLECGQSLIFWLSLPKFNFVAGSPKTFKQVTNLDL